MNLTPFSTKRFSNTVRRVKTYGLLVALAAFAVSVSGYHYSADDGAIFVPEIVQHLHPSLYPVNAAFFHAHGSLSIFAVVASAFARLLSGSVPLSLFLLHCLCILAVLASGFRLAERLFDSGTAAWSAVCVLAGVLTVFVAGTSIPIMDPYFTARTLSTPLTLIALTTAVAGSWIVACVLLLICLAVHPQMALFGICLVGGYAISSMPAQIRQRVRQFAGAMPAVLPLGLSWGRAPEPYRQAMLSRTFFFANRWTSIEWAGVVIPMLIFFWLWRVPLRYSRPALRRLCGGTFLCGTVATFAFLIVSLSPNLESFVRLQPMRMFQMIYIVLFLIVGGLIGQYVLKCHAWRWSLLLLAFGIMDVSIDHAAYPHSQHIEWPGVASPNPWIQGFDWIRLNTPQDALFALPPQYMHAPGEDMHGFRGIAERSALADQIKDSGVVSMFPDLAFEWKQQVTAQAGWNSFTPADFQRLANQFQVNWVIVQLTQSAGLNCPYRNGTVAVCRIV